jgi:hypothetical protein
MTLCSFKHKETCPLLTTATLASLRVLIYLVFYVEATLEFLVEGL